MDELAFLTLILLINYRIPHVLIEFHECYFLAKNKSQSYPLTQGAKVSSNYASPRSHHMDWRARQWSKPMYQTLRKWKYKRNLLGSLLVKVVDQGLGPLVGQTYWPAHQGTPQPTFFLGGQLSRDFLMTVQGATRAKINQNCWWTPSINMRWELLIEMSQDVAIPHL